MTHVIFDPDKVDWDPFIRAQEGRGKYFVGSRYQRGYGLLHNVARFLLPIAKNIAQAAGNEGVAVGSKVLEDVAQGKDIKTSIIEHGKRGVGNLATKLQQCGKGKKLKRQRKIVDQFSI